jgi:hypothetical protein
MSNESLTSRLEFHNEIHRILLDSFSCAILLLRVYILLAICRIILGLSRGGGSVHSVPDASVCSSLRSIRCPIGSSDRGRLPGAGQLDTESRGRRNTFFAQDLRRVLPLTASAWLPQGPEWFPGVIWILPARILASFIHDYGRYPAHFTFVA